MDRTTNSQIQINKGGQFNIGGNAHFELINFTMEARVSNSQGGIINAFLGTSCKLNISGCNFIGCNSSTNGGALYITCNNYGQATLDQVQFINCRSNDGGGMYGSAQSNGALLINQSKFTDCNSIGAGGGGGSGLFALIYENGYLTISGVCTFKNCSCSGSSSSGGGCYINALNPNYNINITGELLFEGCKGYQGGGLAISLSYIGQFQMNKLSFNECSCFGLGGGGVYFQIQTVQNLTITGNYTFYNCSSTSTSSGYGGGLYLSSWDSGSQINFTGELEFDQCKATDGGGMYIYIQYLGTLEINNATFKYCQSSNGGGLYISTQNSGEINITSSQFLNCSALNSGGGLYFYNVSNKSIELSNVTFNNCSAVNGGGIYSTISTGGKLTINSSTSFSDCNATSGSGGAINIVISGGSVELSGVTVDNCRGISGGGIYTTISTGGKLIIEDQCLFSDCQATSGNGGGLFININNFTSQFQFKINNTLIQECQAKSDENQDIPPSGYGGCLFLAGNGDYDPSSELIDLRGMNIYRNRADNGGYSVFAAMTKVADLCKYGGEGEYVKGNYSDTYSDVSDLEGIPVNSSTFSSYSTSNISLLQKYLKDYWNEERNEYFIKSDGSDDSNSCNSTNPCKTLDASVIQTNINSETVTQIYIYDNTSINSTAVISQTATRRTFRNNPLSSIQLSRILINTDGKFNISGKVRFQLINFTMESTILLYTNLGIYGLQSTAEIDLQDCEFHLQNLGSQIARSLVSVIRGGSHIISNLKAKDISTEENIIKVNFNETGSIRIINSQFENITKLGDTIAGGIIKAVLSYASNIFNVTNCTFTSCKAQNTWGGAINAEIQNTDAQMTLSRTQFLQCEGLRGGGLYSRITGGGKLILQNTCSLKQCKATSGNGGGIYADMTFSADSSTTFIIRDSVIQNCQAVNNISPASPTGYGGGIFLTGTGSYEPSQKALDFRWMNITGNTAGRGGQSLYVVMTKLAEWCSQGSLGEYVKGNYSDTLANLNDLEGVIMESNAFQGLSQEEIQEQQYHLQYFWVKIATLTRVEVTLNISNTNLPLQFTIKGSGIIAGVNLRVKIIQAGLKTSVNKELSIQQYNADDVIYPPEDGSGTPIQVEGNLQDEQTATFGMKIYKWFDYNKYNYNFLISNDGSIFTGVEGKEGASPPLNVIELEVDEKTDEETDEEQKQEEIDGVDSPKGFSFPKWMIILIAAVGVLLIIIVVLIIICCICRRKKQKDKKKDHVQMENENAPFNTTWDKTDFEKVKKLGRGGFGTVWCMMERSTQRVVAIKVVDYDNEQAQQMILKERDIMLNIYESIKKSSPPGSFIHVVQPLGFFLSEDSTKAYLVLEFCEKGDLRKYINNMRSMGAAITDRKAFELIAQITSAVHQLHINNIIHGDLKPENVLVMKDYRVKLSDFGLARKIEEGRDYLTAMGGTTLYLGPELLQNKVEPSQGQGAKKLMQTPAADIWAIGVMMFELLAQRHPFFDAKDNNLSLLELIRRITEEQPAELPSHYSENLRKLIKNMLSKDPSRRITSADILEIPEVAECLTRV
ncbi:MAG: putative NEK protein kinase [Streblomastix strix]|uniref:non-specific serine/threonine protein kinase n=1 Tax=Streblomastix strix TaxID=222440 RepID=A0A5J4X1M7_9EUKA|nr:MAG: putative NEK protein kinase [Streblomastix strix]